LGGLHYALVTRCGELLRGLRFELAGACAGELDADLVGVSAL
jgi:hypothetical protein